MRFFDDLQDYIGGFRVLFLENGLGPARFGCGGLRPDGPFGVGAGLLQASGGRLEEVDRATDLRFG